VVSSAVVELGLKFGEEFLPEVAGKYSVSVTNNAGRRAM
jgi:hypothetical protein